MVEVERDDDLGVAVADERVPGLVFQLFADAVVVVELAIDDGVDFAAGGVEGLGAFGGEVVDGEADVA